MLLLLTDGTRVPVTELPGAGPWTFLLLHPDPPGPPDPFSRSEPDPLGPSDPFSPSDPASTGPAGPEPGEVARSLTRLGRVVVPDLRERPGWGEPPGGPGFLSLVDDLDQVRTRAGLGRPVLVGQGELAPAAVRAAADQPWAWRALVLAPHAAPDPVPAPAAAELGRLDLPALVLEAGEAPGGAALERLLGQLGGRPGWAGIAPDAPPR